MSDRDLGLGAVTELDVDTPIYHAVRREIRSLRRADLTLVTPVDAPTADPAAEVREDDPPRPAPQSARPPVPARAPESDRPFPVHVIRPPGLSVRQPWEPKPQHGDDGLN